MKEQLASVEKFGLVNDAWAVTLAGLVSPIGLLELIDQMRDERDVNVWATMIGSCHQLQRILDDDQCERLAERVCGVVVAGSGAAWLVVKAGEGEFESQLRGDLIAALGTIGEDKNASNGRASSLPAMKKRRRKSIAISFRRWWPSWRIPARFPTTRISTEDSKTPQTPQEETRYLFALANFREPELIDRTLGSDDQRPSAHAKCALFDAGHSSQRTARSELGHS